MTTPARWACDMCGAEIVAMQRGNHVRWRCPKQGNMLKALERQRREAEMEAAGLNVEPQPRFWQCLPCLCGCGEQVGQMKGQRKQHYLNTEHYEAHRAIMRRNMARNAHVANAPDEAEHTQERRLSEEVAPVVAKEEEAMRSAVAVRILTGEASHSLWGACLGVVL